MEQGSSSKRLILGPRSARPIDDMLVYANMPDYWDHSSLLEALNGCRGDESEQIAQDKSMTDTDSSNDTDSGFFVPPNNMTLEEYKYRKDFEARMNSFLNVKVPEQALKKKENTKKYHQLLEATEGFYAGFWPLSKINPSCGIYPCSLKWDVAINAAKHALLELQLEFVQLVRANAMLCSNTVLYLTIEASDTKFYEAKVNDYQGIQTVDFVRPAVHYPDIDEKLNHLKTYDPDECPDDGSWENVYANCV